MGPDGWEEVALGDLVHIKHGFAFKGQYFRGEPCPDVAVTPGNFAIGGGYQEKKLKYYDGPVPDGYVLRGGDLLVTMTDLSKTSDTLGYAALVPDDLHYRLLHNQRIGLVQLEDPSRATKSFLHWVMRSRPYRHEVLASASGSTVKHTSPSRISAYRFPLPPLSEQRSIAAVLGALDDKIELNRMMNRTLEEMAQAIFKSWFIDFDGHDDLVDSELGPIPRGWGVGEFGSLAFQHRETVKPERIAPDEPYIGLADMPQGSIALGSWGIGKDATSAKSRFRRGDLLFGKLRPYFKKVGVAPRDGVCSSDVLVIRPRTAAWRAFSLGVLTFDPFIEYATAVSTGTRMPRANWKTLARYQLAIPPARPATRFDQVVAPMVQRILGNLEESRTLADLRDTLLPKLISGELRVPEAEDLADNALASPPPAAELGAP